MHELYTTNIFGPTYSCNFKKLKVLEKKCLQYHLCLFYKCLNVTQNSHKKVQKVHEFSDVTITMARTANNTEGTYNRAHENKNKNFELVPLPPNIKNRKKQL